MSALSDADMDHLVQQTRTFTPCGRITHGEMTDTLRWMESIGQTFTPIAAMATAEPQVEPAPGAVEDPKPVENAQVEGDDAEPESRGRLFR